MLVAGVALVCKPDFIVTDNQYYIGVFLASTACITGGMMDVLVAKCDGVSASVLVIWTAIMGLIISIIYCLYSPSSSILSADIINITPQSWAIYSGELGNITVKSPYN